MNRSPDLNLPHLRVNDKVTLFRVARPREKLTLAELDGPGCINHIWICPGLRDRKNVSRNFILRIFFDDLQTPNVEAPVGDFFGVMHGLNWYPINTEYLSVMEYNGYNCYFPMPFASGARIEVELGGEQAEIALTVDWQRFPQGKLEEENRFCARWRRENPTEKYGREYLICDADGPGRFMGFVYGVRLHDNTDRWSHGGAENFYIDGDGPYPAYLRGLGGEDAFGISYGGALHHSETTLYASMPYYTHEDTGEARPAQRVTGYRFYIKDPVCFQKSVQVRFGCMENEICSTAYWYSKEPVREFHRLGGVDNLLPGTPAKGEDLPLSGSGVWRLCGPFPGRDVFSLKVFMENQDNLKSEKTFPLDGERRYGKDGKKYGFWTEAKAAHNFVDFRHFYRIWRRGVSPTEDGYAVAFCALNAEEDTEATLMVSWDDDLLIYYDGKIIDMGNHGAFRTKEIKVKLKKGKTPLALALGNTAGSNHGGWCFAFSAKTTKGEALYPAFPG
jgi:hypothetical protein